MIKKTVIWVCVLVFVASLSFPAFADQSIAYQEYFNQGVQAFKEHDDQKALRCFKIAEIYDPTDKDLKRYLSILEQRGTVLVVHPSQVPPEQSIGYRYYLKEGIDAFNRHDNAEAIHDLTIAVIFYPDSQEADRYLRILATPAVIETRPQAIPSVHPQPEAVNMPQTAPAVPAAQYNTRPVQAPAVAPVQVQPQPQPQPEAVNMPQTAPASPAAQYNARPVQAPAVAPVQAQPQPAAAAPQSAIYVPEQKSKQPPVILPLDQIANNGQIKPKLQIAYHSSVILQGRNIQRFLVVDEGFIGVKITDTDHLQIDGLRIGTTFLHIWDDFGRHSFYVEVVFPQNNNAGRAQENNGVYHSIPFTATYTNDWTTYYSGKNIPALKRQSYEFDQSLAVKGETPYGLFDTSGSYTDFDSISEIDTYTIGLSQIPLEGTSNFNLRGFDALRYLSPLTMPTTRLRGAFADVDLLDNTLGVSLSHGQEQQPLGFIPIGGNPFLNSYIDAVKLTLFPKSDSDQYSFNFATAYGPDHPEYLTNHVYSVEGQHKFNDFLTLNAEEASDSSHDSSLASLQWQQMGFKTGLNFRNIDKDYSTISTLPAYQGETGVVWTTDTDLKNIQEDSFIEAYQDRLDSNPDDSSAYNFDGNGHIKANITDDLWSDSDFNYVDTPGELSPVSTLGLNERISRRFGIWDSMQGTVFGGVGYQNSHSTGSDISDYGREDVIAGVQLPLTHQVSTYANYEYDWLSQPADAGGSSNPSVVNAGLSYQKQVNSRLSFTSQLDYHDELGVRSMNNSFLSGEESVIVSAGFNYNPTPDLNIFGDCDTSKVLSHIGDPSYDDFEVHVGMKITFGGATYWDPLGTVSGIVFKDRNGDGKFAPGDEGIEGVKVKVGDKEATTDKYGRYRIQIRAKAVDVVPVLDTIPGGLIFSTQQAFNVQVFQGRTTHADFGLISQTGIYGIVFVSKNGNTAPGEGDKFVGKVRVILDGKDSQRSDPHGAFYFRKVSPGKHTISIDINTLGLDMVPMIKLKNTVDVAEGTNYMFNIPVKIEKAQIEEK